MEFYFYCCYCGLESWTKKKWAYAGHYANGDSYTCPDCGRESIQTPNTDDEDE